MRRNKRRTTVRPALTLDDIELLKRALGREGLAVKTIEELEACTELSAMLEKASWPLRRFTSEDSASDGPPANYTMRNQS